VLRRQLADLRAAERWLRGESAGIEVTKFYAWRADGAVSFEPIA
jgi:hypothetical protein